MLLLKWPRHSQGEGGGWQARRMVQGWGLWVWLRVVRSFVLKGRLNIDYHIFSSFPARVQAAMQTLQTENEDLRRRLHWLEKAQVEKTSKLNSLMAKASIH